MVSRINKLSMKEILVKVGFPITINEFRSTYKLDVDIDNAVEFEKRLGTAKQYQEIIQTISDYEDIFDKELYVLHLGRLLDRDIEATKRAVILEKNKIRQNVFTNDSTGKNKRRFLVNAKELLKGSDVADLEINSSTKEIIINTSQEFVGNTYYTRKREQEANEKLKRIDETIGLEKVLGFLVPSDLIELCKYPNLGNLLAVNLYKSSQDVLGKTYTDPIKGIENGSVEEELAIGVKPFDWNEFEQTVRKYIKYIDIDKMLVLANAVYYNSLGENFEEFTEKMQELKEFTESVESIITSKKISFDSRKFGTSINFKAIRESVVELANHFINGKYYNYEEKAELIEGIIYGNFPINSISKSEFENALNMTEEEIGILIRHNPDALQYLLENDILDDSKLEEVLTYKSEFTDSEFLYLVQANKFDNSKIVELYYKGKVSLDNIRFAKLNLENRDLLELVSPKELVELYLDPEKKEEFEKYRKLFKVLVIDETQDEIKQKEAAFGDEEKLTEIEKSIQKRKKEIDTTILEQSDELLYNERLYELYRMGLITVDTVIEYVGKEAVVDLYSSKELKPIDARKLFDDEILTETMLEEVFKSDKLSETEKLVLIYSTFPSEEKNDSELRTKFIKLLKEPVNSKQHSLIGDRKNAEEQPNEFSDIVHYPENRTVTDPCARWMLISSLDKEYSQEYLKDGTILFYLPNKACYITEKLYDRNNNPAYGYATYVVDEDVFEKNRNEIIKDETLNQRYLVALKKRNTKGVTKLVHMGWGNAISRYFDFDEPSKYTDEERKNIKKLADRVERSKEPLSRDDD